VPGSACTVAVAPATFDWNNRVWYEVFVRSFADGNGDGIGDFRGLTAKLDYLNDGNPATTTDLGVTGIWLMPIFASPSYHGYDVIDYREIQKAYGTSSDFKAFLAAAHKRGIKVILDLPLNHTSDQNPWFVAAQKAGSASADWYIWSATNPSYLGPDGQVAWHPLGSRWYYGIFSDAMPDLNYRTPAVTAAMDAVARYWLVDVGIDGFRLDAAKYLIEDGRKQSNTPETHAWLQAFHAATTADRPGSMLVGEVWDAPTVAGSYVPASTDLTFNFGLAQAVTTGLQAELAAPLQTGISDTLADWPPNQSATFLSNHDQPRIATQLNGDMPSTRLAALLLLTDPGVPFIYYGEELGMPGSKPDERIRAPMPWTAASPAGGFSTTTPWEPLGDGWQTANVAAETSDLTSLLSLYRSLIRLHESEPALESGATAIVDGGADSVIGILRSVPGRSLLTVVNLGTQPVSEYGLSLGSGPLCGPVHATVLASVGLGTTPPTATDPTVTGTGGLAAWRPLPTLPPRSGLVLALEPASSGGGASIPPASAGPSAGSAGQ
jgi:alpha-amylase